MNNLPDAPSPVGENLPANHADNAKRVTYPYRSGEPAPQPPHLPFHAPPVASPAKSKFLLEKTSLPKALRSIPMKPKQPIHIHTALLLLGAKNGSPAMRQPINDEATRWADLPPKGDLIDVFLEFKDLGGILT